MRHGSLLHAGCFTGRSTDVSEQHRHAAMSGLNTISVTLTLRRDDEQGRREGKSRLSERLHTLAVAGGTVRAKLSRLKSRSAMATSAGWATHQLGIRRRTLIKPSMQATATSATDSRDAFSQRPSAAPAPAHPARYAGGRGVATAAAPAERRRCGGIRSPAPAPPTGRHRPRPPTPSP
ncbi:hypothetical protein SODG_003247 [Sodalis praecaptivus]